MRGYHHSMFRPEQIILHQRARQLVRLIPEPHPRDAYRCHEIARVVQHFVGGTVVDGHYGMGMEHSWISLGDHVVGPMMHGEVLLDAYAIGNVEMVQLLFLDYFVARRFNYQPREPRTDIRTEQVQELIRAVQSQLPSSEI